MRLVLPFPNEWPVETCDGYVRAIVPGHLADPDLLVLVTDVHGLPPVIDKSFLVREMSLEMPRGARCQIEDARDDQSKSGWPITVVRAGIHLDGVLVEQRLAALFRLIDSYAAAIVVGRDPARWKELVDGLGGIVLAGDVDWSGPPASLAEILGLDADHPIFRPPA